jgi:hypothetical protein
MRSLTVDILGLADDVVARPAVNTLVAMTAVPSTADALAELPFILTRRDRNDRADDFMSGNAWVLHTKLPIFDDLVTEMSKEGASEVVVK